MLLNARLIGRALQALGAGYRVSEPKFAEPAGRLDNPVGVFLISPGRVVDRLLFISSLYFDSFAILWERPVWTKFCESTCESCVPDRHS